jgi:hypothetical protein
MALERDEDEERLARIEQILEDALRDFKRARAEHRQALAECGLARQRSTAAREALRKTQLEVARRNTRQKKR